MSQHLQETGDIVIPGVGVALTDPNAPHTTPYVYAADCDHVVLLAHLTTGGAATAAEQVQFEVLAADDAAGTNATVVKFQWVYDTLGAATIAAGTGIATKREQVDGNSIPSPQAAWSTLVANGDKQNQIAIPIRARQMPQGKKFLALRLTPGATDRTAIFAAIRVQKQYGESARASLFA